MSILDFQGNSIMKRHPLSSFTSIAAAIAKLFHPSVEVVIHDIFTDTVFYIENPTSGREVGDASLLSIDSKNLDDRDAVIGPYEKAGEKGQRVRSITSVLRNDRGNVIGLLCINLDYSTYEPALDLLESLIRPVQTEKHPEFLFQNDWRDLLKIEVRSFITQKNLLLEKLRPSDRKNLISHLDEKRLFYAKKSVEQLATILGVSRATAYKDLRSVRKKNSQTSSKKSIK